MKIPSKTLYVVLVYTLFHILIFCNADDENIVIKTSIGNIIGLKDDKVNVFRGIPYAEPPIGVRRFRPPLTKSPFAYPFEAFNYSAECLQSSLFSTDDMSSRDEDCLYLNLWTPRGSERQVKGKVVLYPVLVWIYGGAFMQGAASKPLYHAHNLASRGIVVVFLC
jgi:para-nitrobenzyl esterase